MKRAIYRNQTKDQFEFEEFDQKQSHKPSHLPRRNGFDKIAVRYRMAEYECKKRKKNIFKWNISMEDFRWLCEQPCFYCSGKLGKVEFGKGLDRIDSKKDYDIDNVYPCCTTCNRIKGHDLTATEAKVVVEALLIYRKSRNV